MVVFFYLWDAHLRGAGTPSPDGFSGVEGVKLADIHYRQDNPDKGVKWVLDAREATVSKDRQFVFFKFFHLTLEPKDRPVIELEGERGEYDKAAGTLALYKNLRGQTGSGYGIVADHITYSHEEGNLQTDSPVKIIGPSFTVEGTGLFVDLKTDFFRIHSDVKAVVNAEAHAL